MLFFGGGIAYVDKPKSLTPHSEARSLQTILFNLHSSSSQPPPLFIFRFGAAVLFDSAVDYKITRFYVKLSGLL